MNINMIRQALTVAAIVATLPLQAHAYDVVNTAVPGNGLFMSNTVDSGNWMAEKFSVSSATQIDSVLAYVLSNDASADAGKSFTIALYADSSNLPSLDFNAINQGQLFQTTATYNADGWTGVSGLNWSINAGGYWIALEGGSDVNSAMQLQAPTGALPVAQAVAYYAGGQHYAATGLSDAFGLHVTAVTPAVPEPGSLALMLTSIGVLALVARRRG
jgi:hypothetical protein